MLNQERDKLNRKMKLCGILLGLFLALSQLLGRCEGGIPCSRGLSSGRSRPDFIFKELCLSILTSGDHLKDR